MMFIFSSRQRLNLLLKLPGVEDFLMNFLLFCGVRPLYIYIGVLQSSKSGVGKNSARTIELFKIRIFKNSW